MGAFDDLIPSSPQVGHRDYSTPVAQRGVGAFDDLIPKADTGEGDGFLAKIQRALGVQDYQEPLPEVPGEEHAQTPEWFKAPEAAVSELVGGMVPHDLPSYLKSIIGPAGMAYDQASGLARGDVSSIPFVGRVPELIEAENTPAGSKERYLAAMKTLMDVGMLAGAGGERAPSPLRAEPLVPEPPPTQSMGPGTIAGDVSRAMERSDRRLTTQAPEQSPEQLADAIRQQETQSRLDAINDVLNRRRQAAEVIEPPVPEEPHVSPETGFVFHPEPETPVGELQRVNQMLQQRADLMRGISGEVSPESQLPAPSVAERNGQILEKRQELLTRQKDLKQRFINGEHGVAPELEAVEAEIKASPVVHAPPPVTEPVAPVTQPVPQEGPVQAQEAPPIASEAPGGVPVAGTGRIVAAAVRDDLGNVYTGTTHGTASDAALAAGARLPKVRKGELGLQIADQGFVTDKGEYLTNEEAYHRALENKQIKPQNAPLLEAYTFNKQQPRAEPPPATPALEVQPEPYTQEAAAQRAAAEATSTKNAVTAAEREARGLPPAEEAAARDFGTVWDESAKDTAAPARLVAALKVEPRALSDVENAHLLRRQIELQTEHDTMTKAVNEASDPAVAAEAKQRLETVRNDLQDVYDVGKAAGTETGRGLNARKMLADQDYALANMEATTRALMNDGKPLSEAQLSEVAKLHERIRTAEDKLAAYESQEIFNQSLKVAPRRPVLSFLDEQAVKARERINARRTRLYADPLGVTNVAHLADEAIIGASHIARGVTKFADWSAQMVSEFGDRIKPYLAALFEKSKQQFKAASAGLKKAPVTYAEREARALAGEKKGIITRTEKLIGRTEVVTAEHPFGEFEPLKRRPPRMDPEKAQLQYEYSKAKEAFDRGIYEAELKKRSVPERILGTAREVLNMPRSLLASADLSAVRRQGGIYTMIHPFHARHAFRAMLEATKSEQGYFKVMQEIRDRPNAPEYQRYGLELTDIGPVTRAKMEEQFQSRWANKIPGISHSQRAYTGFLNRARADWFDLLKDSLAKKGEPLAPKQGKAIANAVNVFTGRGAMNQKWIGAMTALNDVFFAPRWRASRFQTLIGQPLWKNSGARGVIAKEYAKALIGYGSILTLIGWATKNTLHPMEKNPVSTEAGKLRIGNTRIDFLQGLQQPTVLLSRLLSGRTKTAAGEVQKIYGDVPLGKTTSSDIITRFLRSSLAPVPSGVWNTLEQKNVIGEPVTLPSTVRDLTIPLLGKDIYDAMRDQGVPIGTALGLLALFGDGIQTYSPRVSHKEPKRELTVSQQIKADKARRTRERKKELQGQMTP